MFATSWWTQSRGRYSLPEVMDTIPDCIQSIDATPNENTYVTLCRPWRLNFCVCSHTRLINFIRLSVHQCCVWVVLWHQETKRYILLPAFSLVLTATQGVFTPAMFSLVESNPGALTPLKRVNTSIALWCEPRQPDRDLVEELVSVYICIASYRNLFVNNLQIFWPSKILLISLDEVQLKSVCAKFHVDRTKSQGGVRKSRFFSFCTKLNNIMLVETTTTKVEFIARLLQWIALNCKMVVLFCSPHVATGICVCVCVCVCVCPSDS